MDGSAEFQAAGIRFQPRPRDASLGLLGWVSFTLGPLRIDGVAVRRTAKGRPVLSFPCRRDRSGREHPYVCPLDDHARRDLEFQILGALGLDTEDAR